MSGDYWLNRIGTAAAVTTPAGTVPEYGLAADIGTAAWPDAQTFNAWAQDGVVQRRSQDIAAMEAAKDQADAGWFQKLKANAGEFFSGAFGSVHRTVASLTGEDTYDSYARGGDAEGVVSREDFQALDPQSQNELLGGRRLASAPGMQAAQRYVIDPLETPFIMDRNSGLRGDFGLWFDGSEWAAAWREAEERTIGEALLDSVLVATQGTTKRDLDRMRRTNSLYGMTSFAGDLYLGFKFDPTVGAAKVVGETKRISIGALPRGQTSQVAAAEARRTAFAKDPRQHRYEGRNPLGYYGAWRGRNIAARFDGDLRQRALDMDYTDFSNLPMFRRRAVNGAPGAYALWLAAKDDNLWDLSRRAILGDARAYAEINDLKHSVPEALEKYAGADTRTFIDAVEATKTKLAKMDHEVQDLEKAIARQEAMWGPTPREGRGVAPGLFENHSWELHRKLDDKVADIEEATLALESQDDYGAWLESIEKDGVWAHIDQVSTKEELPWANMLSSRTYQKSPFGPAHTVSEISKAGWMKKANPIDLHRVDSGVMSIRRQFEQFSHFFNYVNRDALEDVLIRFNRAKDPLERWRIAKEVEDVHLVHAVAGHHGLAPETVEAFLRSTRLRRNEMAEALLSGQGAVYSTSPLDTARVLKIEDGMATVRVKDNGRVHTMRIPEESLYTKGTPVDPTQTPNYYEPMDTREVHLAIKRHRELFDELDTEARAWGRDRVSRTMEAIDRYGTAFNAFWKPYQLFRLAWPQRVLIDENLRAMAMLGATEWGKAWFPALTDASLNAINPRLHPGTWPGVAGAFGGGLVAGAALGPLGLLPGIVVGAGGAAKLANTLTMRRRLKIGPGPLADELTGRTYDVAAHEQLLADTPSVPASLAPRPNKQRRQALDTLLGTARADRRYRAKRAALLLEGVDGLPERGYELPHHKAVGQFISNKSRKSVLAYDPVQGRRVRTGYGVPVFTRPLAASGRDIREQVDEFVEEHQDLLASPGYRVLLRKTDDGIEASVVRTYPATKSDEAAVFAIHAERDFFDLSDGARFEHIPSHKTPEGPDLDADLEKVHAAVLARSQNTDDPVYQALKGREERMLLERGLQYADDGDNWYTEAPVPPEQVPSWLDRQYERLTKKREYGKGKSVHRTHDGRQVETDNIFEGEGEPYVFLTSSSPAYARLTDTYKRTSSRLRQKAVGYKRTLPPDVSPQALGKTSGRRAALDYYASWATLLNTQLRNSPIWRRMLAGETDEEIIRWLTTTNEGGRLRRSLPHVGRTPELWVERHRQRLDFYVPDPNLQRLLNERELTPSDLFKVDSRRRPEIYEPDLQDVSGDSGFAREKSILVERIYRALGTVPTDLLSRQPFAKAMYDLKMRNLIAATDAEYLTPEIQRAFQKLSREFALRQVRRTLFDLTDEDNFTQALRFTAPFWGAQREALTKWFNIAFERPETVARFYVGSNLVYQQMLVIDEQGRPVDQGDGLINYNPNHRVIIQIPERLKKVPFFGAALDAFGSNGIPIGSANTALQGDNPILPSWGPIVTVPADWMADRMWETHGTQFDNNFFYRWLFPVGRPKAPTSTGEFLETIMPGWGRRMQALQAGEDSRLYMNTWFMIQREKMYEASQRGLPPPSEEEITRATKWHFGLRVLASFALPVNMEFRPEHQFFLDQYHEMQRQYGPGQAFEKFYEKFGEAASQYAASSSSGLAPPTAKGAKEWSQNRSLVQEAVKQGFPDLASAIFSPEAWTADFSSDTYNEQFKLGIGGGSSKKLRESQDPQERINESSRRVGWLKYRQFMSSINAELYNRGLTSLDQRGAEDLEALRTDWIADLERENTAWGLDYRTYSDTIYPRVEFMRRFAFEARFDDRPDIVGLRQYLLIRDATAQSLDEWAAQGGSRSLQSQENTDLRNWFYDQVGQLIQANPAFGEFYVRFLEADRLERGSGPYG